MPAVRTRPYSLSRMAAPRVCVCVCLRKVEVRGVVEEGSLVWVHVWGRWTVRKPTFMGEEPRREGEGRKRRRESSAGICDNDALAPASL